MIEIEESELLSFSSARKFGTWLEKLHKRYELEETTPFYDFYLEQNMLDYCAEVVKFGKKYKLK